MRFTNPRPRRPRSAAAAADLARLKAGAWSPDLAIARAAVASAEATTRCDEHRDRTPHRRARRSTAPCCRSKIRKGEYASAGPLSQSLMLIGNIDTLHVRVDIDENDAWRMKPNAQAEGSIRGNRSLKTQLKFVRIEPYIVPKRSLTGDSNERVDTRVLQAIYAFDSADFAKANGSRVYPGPADGRVRRELASCRRLSRRRIEGFTAQPLPTRERRACAALPTRRRPPGVRRTVAAVPASFSVASLARSARRCRGRTSIRIL